MEDEATEPPNFSQPPMNRTVREGDSATFDCRVTSYSRPHIKWLKKVEAMDTGFNLSEVREGFKKSKWKFKMAFAMKGWGGSRGGLECHIPILKNDFC